jgi:hypothetical protein
VSQRLAAHKSHTGLFCGQAGRALNPVVRQGARAAAPLRPLPAWPRVMLRSPSYSQMQSAEAQAALRAAEIATQAALEAQTAAQAALEDLRIATAAGPRLCEPEAPQAVALAQPSARDREPAPFQLTAPSSLEAWEKECSIRWEPDLRLRPIEPAEARAPQTESAASSTAGEPWEHGRHRTG